MFKSILSKWAKYEVWVSLGCLIFAIIFPLVFSSRYVVNIGVLCLLYIVLSLSLNLITGFMGITTLGHAAFYGVGAYTAAILSTRLGWNFVLTFIAAIIEIGRAHV